MGKPTTREACVHLRAAKRNAGLKGKEVYRGKRRSTKRMKVIQNNNEIIKKLRENL